MAPKRRKERNSHRTPGLHTRRASVYAACISRQRMVNKLNDAKEHTALAGKIEKIREILAEVMDPEVPVLSVLDLGIVRDIKGEIKSNGEESWTIVITPTYTACPAMDTISMNIRLAMIAHGFINVNVEIELTTH